MTEPSIFTKIIAGEIPCHKIYEDEFTLAFLDINPKNEGHTLVIPKIRPTEFVWDLDPEVYSHVMTSARRVALRLREVLRYQHVHMAVVGVDVPYAHVHLVPFDTISQLEGVSQPTEEELAAVAEKLRFPL